MGRYKLHKPLLEAQTYLEKVLIDSGKSGSPSETKPAIRFPFSTSSARVVEFKLYSGWTFSGRI